MEWIKNVGERFLHALNGRKPGAAFSWRLPSADGLCIHVGVVATAIRRANPIRMRHELSTQAGALRMARAARSMHATAPVAIIQQHARRCPRWSGRLPDASRARG
ncbi:conserved hypothetical protein, partial [Ricinus communis]